VSPPAAAGHEHLAARTTVGDPTPTGSIPIRGVAVGENDITKGQSGQRTRWPADVLRTAADQLAGETAKLVRGPGGETAHHSLDKQVPVEDIVGSVAFDYEPGVGLTFEGEIVDESVARQIQAGLLEVSPDLYRRLAPPDSGDTDGVRDVAEILSIPRVTLVDQGAAPSASIEMAGGAPEALAEYLAKPPEEDRSEEEVEQLAASTLTLADLYEIERAPDNVTASEYLAQRYGIDASAFGDEEELLAAVREVRR